MSTMSTPAAEQRKLVEQLMGRDFSFRHNRYSHKKRDLGLHDPKICKSYLVGECPYDLFQGTKQSLGKCPQMHLTKHKIQYEREVKQGKTFPEFEREYLAILSRFVNECNGQISVALQNLKHTAEERMKIQQVTEELDVLDVRIGLMGQEIDSLIRADEVTMGMLQSVKLQELINKRKEVAKRVRNITENVGQSAQQKLQVCEVCGAYLSRLDTDRRLADHFLGKIHLGYVKMREDYDRLMKNNRTTNASKTATTLPGRRFV
ncbi:BMC_2a_G0008250.mRNA.1.CDS.1 [Saccharomyces cerevisiae]|nr:Luc7p [Saccharomyces cerevisiae YJM1447]CAI4320625.1 BMC_2a_G0008250.mRNA.1.CDS.1 [Saccharomyces cerevisiae]CAI4321973.1 BMB_G0008210.mRNA.1.CDS.1 [Saccharomyces cerevisiae]CAI7064855.1 BMC_2a_G0008250.mRNA.1.CDS.1 [Saccharomyces cerevisiae]CAI7065931.1 BMB_G0008210.mRNA.1.CDS.1 [Saccharomyces cerevisiae]